MDGRDPRRDDQDSSLIGLPSLDFSLIWVVFYFADKGGLLIMGFREGELRVEKDTVDVCCKETMRSTIEESEENMGLLEYKMKNVVVFPFKLLLIKIKSTWNKNIKTRN